MGLILRVLRLAFRRLLRTPLFTLVAILGIAAGIGSNSAVFSVVNGVIFRPLPFENAERLVVVSGQHPNIGRFSASYPDFVNLKESSTSFEHFAAFYHKSFALTGRQEPERLSGVSASASFFPMLGARPVLGRFFSEEEEARKTPVVVLSHTLWRDNFGSDPTIVNQNLTLNDESYTIIGVAPANFRPPMGAQLWIPLKLSEEVKADRGERFLSMFAKLKPDADPQRALSELNVVASQLQQQYPDTNAGRRIILISLHEELTETDRLPLLLTQGAIAFVLLIACFNLANLLMARALSRTKEIGINLALGASRWNVVMQFLAESLLLVLCGGALGLLVSLWMRDIIVYWLGVSPLIQTDIDLSTLLFTLTLSILTGLLSGLVPALRISRVNPLEILKEGGDSGSTPGRHNLLKVLVSAEVGLALALVIGTILMLKSLTALRQVDLGFNPDNLLTMKVSLPEAKYATPVQQSAFFTEVLQKAEVLPGVQGAALVNVAPLNEMFYASKFYIEGQPPPSGNQINRASYHIVSPQYFSTLKIPLLAGRVFTEQDRKGAQEVVIISQKMAKWFWPGEDPIGKRFSHESAQGPWVTIVGVVGEVKYRGAATEPEPEFYLPYLQLPEPSMALVIRGLNPEALIRPARDAVWAVDKNQPIDSVLTMEQIIDERLGKESALANIIGLFGLTALMLAGLGIYAVTAYSVTQRTREIGIRVALGAPRANILTLIVKQSLLFILAGVAAGVVTAIVLSRTITSLLFGVEPVDAVTFTLSSLILVFIGVTASYIPARRASLVDPAIALRHE